MKKNKKYEGWIISNSIIKRSIANVGYNLLGSIIISIVIAIFAGLFALIFILTTKLLTFSNTANNNESKNIEIIKNVGEDKKALEIKDGNSKNLEDNINKV